MSEVKLTDEERAALRAWWDSEWPRDGRDTQDVLAETVEAILGARLAALADFCEVTIATGMGALMTEYAAGWRAASACFLAEMRDPPALTTVPPVGRSEGDGGS